MFLFLKLIIYVLYIVLMDGLNAFLALSSLSAYYIIFSLYQFNWAPIFF